MAADGSSTAQLLIAGTGLVEGQRQLGIPLWLARGARCGGHDGTGRVRSQRRGAGLCAQRLRALERCRCPTGYSARSASRRQAGVSASVHGEPHLDHGQRAKRHAGQTRAKASANAGQAVTLNGAAPASPLASDILMRWIDINWQRRKRCKSQPERGVGRRHQRDADRAAIRQRRICAATVRLDEPAACCRSCPRSPASTSRTARCCLARASSKAPSTYSFAGATVSRHARRRQRHDRCLLRLSPRRTRTAAST